MPLLGPGYSTLLHAMTAVHAAAWLYWHKLYVLCGFIAWFMQLERSIIPEAQKAEQALQQNAVLRKENKAQADQVIASVEKARRCESSALKWLEQLDDEKTAHRYTGRHSMYAHSFTQYEKAKSLQPA